MAETTAIEWCEKTFNPWSGCTKVAAGCTHCYAEVNYSVKMRGVKWGPKGDRVLASDAMWQEPLKWNRKAEKSGKRPRVFCASLADVFEDWDGPMLDHHGDKLYTADGSLRPITIDDCRRRLFTLIDATPNLNWLILTKRPDNICPMWPYEAHRTGSTVSTIVYRSNVWLGTSASKQDELERNWFELQGARQLCQFTFLSIEPLIEAIDLWRVARNIAPHWVIIGCESGPKRRPMKREWAKSLVDQCREAGVAVFVKQVEIDGKVCGDMDRFPSALQVREFP
jgi:protein gp37